MGLIFVLFKIKSKSMVLGDFTIAATTCGDGVVDLAEQCDDGNVDSYDGCSASCVNEVKKVIFEEDKDFEALTTGYALTVISDPLLSKTGNKALKMDMPDGNHTKSRLDVGYGNQGVLNFSEVDSIKFWIRTTSGTYANTLDIVIQYSGGNDASQNLNILPYVSGGVIDGTYRQVVIPGSAFVGNFGGAFRNIYFSVPASQTPKSFYIDDITLEDTQGLVVEAIEVLDSKNLMLTIDEKLNFASARNVANYTLVNSSDNSKINVSSVGIRRFVTDFSGSSFSPVVKDYIYLDLASPISSNANYSLSIQVKDIIGNLPKVGGVNFSFDFNNDISSSIKVNQVGYLPKSPKRVYVGNYLGDAGQMTLSAGLIAKIKNKTTGQVVLTGALIKSSESDNFYINDSVRPFTGEDVWYLDFTNFETPGSYYIQIDGIGRSYDFDIRDNIYNDVFYTTARALYYQRSGMALTSQYAGIWSRGAAQPTAGYYHNSIKDKSPDLYANEPIGAQADFTGGWFDAADYNKYIRTAAEAVDNYFTMYEIVPTHFSDNQLNIPESHNGVPDILDESKWELDWIAKMVSSNGCTFNKVAFETWSDKMPDLDTRKHWVITKSTEDTGFAAAILAKAARIMQPFFPTDAQRYRDKALLAWQCLEAHPEQNPPPYTTKTEQEAYCNPKGNPALGITDVSSGCYWSNDNRDSRAWAAIELYALTGEQKYEDVFTNLVPTNELNSWTKTDYYYSASNLRRGWDYYNIAGANSERKAVYMTAFSQLMDKFKKDEDQWNYKVAEKDFINVGFGTLSMSTRYSFIYILAHELTGNSYYLDRAKQNIDFQLGANPLSKVFITGIGDNPVVDPLNKVSEFDGIAQPIPGFSVYGPANALPYKSYYIAVLDNAYPAYYGSPGYPTARKYLDNFNITKYSEFVIDDLTRTAAVFGYFSTASAAADTIKPVTTASKASGTYSSAISVTLSASEPATIYYCLGVGCTPNAVYNSALAISTSKTLRFYASDVSGNAEVVKERVYDIAPACIENWSCSAWSTCTSSSQSRTCTDANACGTILDKPTLVQGCSVTCTPNWTCTSWSACVTSSKSRSCSDTNNCNIPEGKPNETTSCTATAGGGAAGAGAPSTDTDDTVNNVIIKTELIRQKFYTGRLIKVANDPAVYHVAIDGKRRLFVNSPTFWSWRTGTWADHLVEVVTQSEFDAIPVAKNVTVRPGSKLIQFKGSNIIYVVKAGDVLCPATFGFGDKWMERLVIIQNSFESDYTRDDSCAISADTLMYPDGSLIQYVNSSDIWYIENNAKRLVTSNVFSSNGFKDIDIVKDVPESVEYSTSEPLEAWE